MFRAKNKIDCIVTLDLSVTIAHSGSGGDGLTHYQSENLNLHLSIMKDEAERAMTDYCYAFVRKVLPEGRR